MSNQIVKFVKITNWTNRVSVEVLGDVSGLVEDPKIETVIAGRRAVVRCWFDDAGNGFEEITTTLHDWEK
jgi:hypothetical protein